MKGLIYLYKGFAYMSEERKGKVKYYMMPDDFSASWTRCSEEMFEAAKYYGVRAKNNTIQYNELHHSTKAHS